MEAMQSFEVATMMLMKILVLWDVRLCELVNKLTF